MMRDTLDDMYERKFRKTLKSVKFLKTQTLRPEPVFSVSEQQGTPYEKKINCVCTRVGGCTCYIKQVQSNKIEVDVESAWPERTQFKDQSHLLLPAAGVIAFGRP